MFIHSFRIGTTSERLVFYPTDAFVHSVAPLCSEPRFGHELWFQEVLMRPHASIDVKFGVLKIPRSKSLSSIADYVLFFLDSIF